MSVHCTIYMLLEVGTESRAYVGKTTQKVKRRLIEHWRDVGRGSQTFLHRTMRKLDKDRFSGPYIIEEKQFEDPVEGKVWMDERESFWIKEYGTHSLGYNSGGFNLTDGGDGGNTGEPWNKGKTDVYSDETRAKMGAANIGRVSGMRDKTHTPEARKKLSESHKGKKLSPESIAKREATRARNRASGVEPKRTMHPDTKAKLLAANKGKVHSPEHIAKRMASIKATKAAKRSKFDPL